MIDVKVGNGVYVVFLSYSFFYFDIGYVQHNCVSSSNAENNFAASCGVWTCRGVWEHQGAFDSIDPINTVKGHRISSWTVNKNNGFGYFSCAVRGVVDSYSMNGKRGDYYSHSREFFVY